jgi:uncharacterized protein (TIGR00645 family)
MFETLIERALFASRWLLAPLYLGLGVVLAAFTVTFVMELVHYLPTIIRGGDETNLVLAALALVDLTLVASLVLMVMISGYENFVSKIELAEVGEKLSWFGKLDSGTLKVKVASSIVAISSIHLLKAFMNVRDIPNDKLMWLVVMHLTFVVSALMVGVLDRLVFAEKRV